MYNEDKQIVTQLAPVPANGHSKNHRVIGGELYYACENCDEKETARSVTWDGQRVAVELAVVPQSLVVYGALYDTDDRMIELCMAETVGTKMEILFDKAAVAEYVKVFFVGQDHMPWLSAAEKRFDA